MKRHAVAERASKSISVSLPFIFSQNLSSCTARGADEADRSACTRKHKRLKTCALSKPDSARPTACDFSLFNVSYEACIMNCIHFPLLMESCISGWELQGAS